MDVADASASDSVMLAFLPTSSDWCKLDLPHLTLVYAGLKKDFTPTNFNDLAKDAASLALLANPFYLVVKAIQQFGPDGDKVNALAFQATPDLWAMRRYVEKWNRSEFPFNPHATIGPTTLASSLSSYVDNVPRSVGFDRLYLGFGDENLTFNLRRGGAAY